MQPTDHNNRQSAGGVIPSSLRRGLRGGALKGGVDKITYHQRLRAVRRKLRSQMTKSETVLWKAIKSQQLGFKFRRQASIGRYVVDFYCAEILLVIEVDGLSHAEAAILERDLQKEDYLRSLGVTIKRYTSQQVLQDLPAVLFDLHHFCEQLKLGVAGRSPS